MDFQKCLCLLLTLFSVFLSSSHAYKFNVGGDEGWVRNPKENYNRWAERNRFLISDTLFFKYKKGSDSVLLVNKDDYNNCNTKNPLLKMDTGDSEFKFNRSGPFYFISGNPDHCQKGQKLLLVVLHEKGPSTAPTTPSPLQAPSPTPATQPPKVMPPSSHAPKGSSPVPATSPSTSPSSQSPVANAPKGLSPAPATSPSTSPSSQSPVANPPEGLSPATATSPSTSPSSQSPVANPPEGLSPATATSPSTSPSSQSPVANPPEGSTPADVTSPSTSPSSQSPVANPPEGSTPADVTPPPSSQSQAQGPSSSAVATPLSLRALAVSLVFGFVLSTFVGVN